MNQLYDQYFPSSFWTTSIYMNPLIDLDIAFPEETFCVKRTYEM